MKRRKAIKQIMLFTGAGIASFSAMDYYIFLKTPSVYELEKNRVLIEALAETIIPATDTPGASQAKVHDFIILMIKDCSYSNTQSNFIEGLTDLKKYCQSNFGKPFTACSLIEKTMVLQHFEKKGIPIRGILGKIQTKLLGRSFFGTLKALTINGYCTSFPGATQGLAYIPVPGKYIGHTVLEAHQKVWATR